MPSSRILKGDPKLLQKMLEAINGPKDLARYFTELQKGSPLRNPGSASEKKVAQGQAQSVNGSTQPLKCSSETIDLARAAPQYAASSFDPDKLWVGALLQSRSLADGVGSLRAVNVPAELRQKVYLTTAAPVTIGTQSIQPTQSEYNVALARMRQGMQNVPMGPQTRYQVTEEQQFDTSALKVGLDARYLTAKASGSFASSSSQQRNRLTAVFYQQFFTVNADLQGKSPAEVLFKTFKPTDWTKVSQQWSMDNPPVYVDSISYGRLLLVSMESSYSAYEMNLALKASYDALLASGGGNVSVNIGKVLSESSFDVYADGGNEQAIIDLIRTQRLGTYFSQTTGATTLKPIAFTTRNMGDNSYAATYRTGQYRVTTCNPAAMKLYLRIRARADTVDDGVGDHTAETYGFIKVNGETLWSTGSANYVSWNEDQTRDFYPDAPQHIYKNGAEPWFIEAPFDGDMTITVDAEFWDWDRSSSNDFMGRASTTINVSEVARKFRDKSNLLEQRDVGNFYVGDKGDDLNSWMYINFYRHW